MKSRFLLVAAAAAVFVVSAARADDPKPAPGAAPAPAGPAAATRHQNKISPEAKAAFEKMDKITNSPVRQGLKEAAGTINTEMMGMVMAMKFTFKAPAAIHVEPDANLQGPMAQMGSQMTRGAERSLRSMLGIYRPADEDEFDAEMTKADGKDVLLIVNFKGDAEEGRTEFTLDANGLPATGVTKTPMGKGEARHEMKSDVVFTWTKSGERFRLEKMQVTSPGMGGGRGMGGGGGGPGKITITPTYTEVESFAIGTSWQTEIEGMGMSFGSSLSDLTVNGKPVEVKKAEALPKPEGPKIEKGAKKEQEEDEGDDEEDDDGDEGHEKK